MEGTDVTERNLYLYEYVDLPFDDVAEVLAADPAALLQPATDAAVEHAHAVHRDLVVELAGFEVGREVTIEVGEFRPAEIRRVTVELRWHASSAAAMFPSMRAILEVVALSFHPPRTQLALVATYEPPLGLVGAAGDRLWGGRVAESAVHRFLHDVVARVEQLVATHDRPVTVPG